MCFEQAVRKNKQIWPLFGFCTADSQTDTGRHQLYINGLLVLYSTAWYSHSISLFKHFDNFLLIQGSFPDVIHGHVVLGM